MGQGHGWKEKSSAGRGRIMSEPIARITCIVAALLPRSLLPDWAVQLQCALEVHL
jgi:hypothetical protein